MKIIEEIIKESSAEIFSEKGYVNIFMVFFYVLFGLACFFGGILNIILGGKKNEKI